jgi:hypothetical protein
VIISNRHHNLLTISTRVLHPVGRPTHAPG